MNSSTTAGPRPPLAPVINTRISRLSHLQADGTHELERVAPLDHSRVQAIVEVHAAVLQVVFEMNVDCARAEVALESCQRKIMSGDESDGATIEEPANDCGSSDSPVVRVCSAQDLVQQEQHLAI